MPKTIKFTASGSCNALGNFAPGDIARDIPDDLAAHLVKDAMCAKYLAPAVPPAPAVQTKTKSKSSAKTATEDKGA